MARGGAVGIGGKGIPFGETPPTAGTAAATFSGAGPLHILQTMRPERWSAPVLGSLTNVQDAQVHGIICRGVRCRGVCVADHPG